MNKVEYWKFPQIAAIGSAKAHGRVPSDYLHEQLLQRFFSRRLQKFRPVIGLEDGGKDRRGRHRGVSFGHDRLPIGVTTTWTIVRPNDVREMMRHSPDFKPGPFDDSRRYAQVTLGGWSPDARKYILDNLALSKRDAEQWLAQVFRNDSRIRAMLSTESGPSLVSPKITSIKSVTSIGETSVLPKKNHGRPRNAGSFAAKDAIIVDRMKASIAGDPSLSPTAAAKKFVADAVGSRNEDSKLRRLVRRYKSTINQGAR